MQPAAHLMYWNRPDFRGLSDKYLERGSRLGITPITGIEAALQGDSALDVIGGMSENYRDLTSERLSRYRYQWKFYNGNHWENPWEDGEKKSQKNYCKLVVDKTTTFFLAKGWEVRSPEGNEQVAEFLNEIWNANNKKSLSQKILQYGAINGDCFLFVTVLQTDPEGNLLPRSEWTVRLVAFDPRYCYPFFSVADPHKIESIMIQFPISGPDNPSETILYTLYITDEFVRVYHNEVKTDERPNPFGRVNVVHFRNNELANSSFGVGDIDDVIPLNEEYNLTANSMRRIIKYHGEPTTLIFGARASDMERGAKKVWSNLPKEAKVENLKLDANIEHVQKRLDKLEESILDVSEIPHIALNAQEQMRVSNTSGIAIQMLYQPLEEKCNRKKISYSQMVKSANELIIIAERDIIGTDVNSLADHPDELDETDVEYTSSLPRDMTAEINQGKILVESGAWSRAEFARRLGGVEDLERLALELSADQQAALVQAYENQRAVMGNRPNMIAAFLGSIGLNEDLIEVAKKVQGLMKKKAKSPVDKSRPVIKPKSSFKSRVSKAA